MLSQLSRTSLAMAALVLLSACSSQYAVDQVAAPAKASAPAATWFGATAGAAAAPSAAPVSDQAYAAGPVRATLVTESERVAEEWRLVDFEQAYSLEMNRRSQEQAEREQRIAVAAHAGIVQGPGCEGSEGQAALDCERSLN